MLSSSRVESKSKSSRSRLERRGEKRRRSHLLESSRVEVGWKAAAKSERGAAVSVSRDVLPPRRFRFRPLVLLLPTAPRSFLLENAATVVPLPGGVGEVALEELREEGLRHRLEAREREEVRVRPHLLQRLAVLLQGVHER